VRLDRVEAQGRRCDAGESKDVLGDHDRGLTKDWIAEGDVDAEGLAVDFPRELALGAEAKPVVRHAVVLDLRVVFVGTDLEREEIAKVATPRLLQPREDVVGRADRESAQ